MNCIIEDWTEQLVDRLAINPICGYGSNPPAATEPTALAALALLTYGRIDPAKQALGWLTDIQLRNGSLGVTAKETSPGWPTALAVLAWQLASSLGHQEFDKPKLQAIDWILHARGEALPRSAEMGHDSMLLGWAWVQGTHSWIEPTAWNVLALKATGHGDHARTREAVRLLFDRLLPGGGCNYGNTTVLDQELRPHVQPTGLALLALAGARKNARVARSLEYLQGALSAETTTASLCYGLLALTAHEQRPPSTSQWLAAAIERDRRRQPSGLKQALAALAAMGVDCPLIQLARQA